MNKIVYSLALVTIIPFLYGMRNECLQLNSIEQQLVFRDVAKQGKDRIRTEIYKETKENTEPMHDKRGIYFRMFAAYKINEIFYKNNIDKDSLTKNIFEKIEEIEKNEGYRPEYDYGADLDINNRLGERTHYWWLQDADNNFLPAIQVKFRPHYCPGDQKAIENLINSYNQ